MNEWRVRTDLSPQHTHIVFLSRGNWANGVPKSRSSKNHRSEFRVLGRPWTEAPPSHCHSQQDPQSSWCPPRTARSMPLGMFPWSAGLRRTLLISLIAGSRTASMSSTLGGALECGCGEVFEEPLG